MFNVENFMKDRKRSRRRKNDNRTKLKDSEERFRKIFESNSDGVAILDQTGNVLMINSAAESLLGKTWV